MVSAAVRQLNTPPVRRPHASDIHEQKKRPTIAEMLSQTTRPEGHRRGDLEDHNEQGHPPQPEPDAAGLTEAGQGTGKDAARVFEELEPDPMGRT